MGPSGHELPVPGGQGRSILSTTAIVHLVELAAQESDGVAGLASTPDVTVDDEHDLVAVTVRVVATYGAALPDLAEDVRGTVAASLATMTGMSTTEIDVVVVDVRTPGDTPGP